MPRSPWRTRATAAGYAADAATADPLRESVAVVHAQALAAAGDRAGALAALDRLRARLRDELGVDPSTESARLRQALLGEPVPGTHGGPVRRSRDAAPGGRSTAWPSSAGTGSSPGCARRSTPATWWRCAGSRVRASRGSWRRRPGTSRCPSSPAAPSCPSGTRPGGWRARCCGRRSHSTRTWPTGSCRVSAPRWPSSCPRSTASTSRSTARPGARSCSPAGSSCSPPPSATAPCSSSTTCSGPIPAASPSSPPRWPGCPALRPSSPSGPTSRPSTCPPLRVRRASCRRTRPLFSRPSARPAPSSTSRWVRCPTTGSTRSSAIHGWRRRCARRPTARRSRWARWCASSRCAASPSRGRTAGGSLGTPPPSHSPGRSAGRGSGGPCGAAPSGRPACALRCWRSSRCSPGRPPPGSWRRRRASTRARPSTPCPGWPRPACSGSGSRAGRPRTTSSGRPSLPRWHRASAVACTGCWPRRWRPTTPTPPRSPGTTATRGTAPLRPPRSSGPPVAHSPGTPPVRRPRTPRPGWRWRPGPACSTPGPRRGPRTATSPEPSPTCRRPRPAPSGPRGHGGCPGRRC